MADEEQVLNLGEIIPKTKKVKLKRPGDADYTTFECQEVTMMQSLRLFELGDRTTKAKTREELMTNLEEFASFMMELVPAAERTIWMSLDPDQVGVLVAYLSPFGSPEMVREYLETTKGEKVSAGTETAAVPASTQAEVAVE